MAWFEIMPRFRALLAGWDDAARFFDWQGILVNRHRQRQVERVTLPLEQGGERFILKKQFRVTWHERFLNAWHGLGWCSTSVREAAMLQAARASGIGCPEVVAFGEDSRRAFVATRAESGMIDLPSLLQRMPDTKRNKLAAALGRALAWMHDRGFYHRDLFAKHILVERAGAYSFCILDWARARWRKALPWSWRRRDLAALDATLHTALASKRVRMRFLRAYLGASVMPSKAPLRRAAISIRRTAIRLAARRNIRELAQLPTPPADFEFVPMMAGALLMVRSYFAQCGSHLPPWLAALGEAGELKAPVPEDIQVQYFPRSAQAWEMPNIAHTLVRLRRFGVPAPRLVAVGATATDVFVVMAARHATPLEIALRAASAEKRRRWRERAEAFLRLLEDAGYCLADAGAWWRHLHLCAETDDIYLANASALKRCDAAPRKEKASAA